MLATKKFVIVFFFLEFFLNFQKIYFLKHVWITLLKEANACSPLWLIVVFVFQRDSLICHFSSLLKYLNIIIPKNGQNI